MKVLVNKDYFVWREDAKNAEAVKWLDRFLVRVFKAADKESAPRVKKGIGSKLSRTVQEYEMGGRKYRVYAKYVVIDGEMTFCAASWHHKNVNKGQNSYVEVAEKLFENFNLEQWAAWEPTAEQLTEYSAADDDVAEEDEVPCAEEVKPVAKKKKGKPVDENGLTTAERKALRSQQQQEAAQQARAEAQRRRKEQAADAAPAQPAEPATPVVDMVAHTPIETPVNNQVNAPAEPQAVAPVAPIAPATPVASAAANDVRDDDEVRVLGTGLRPAPARPAKPKQVVVAVELRELMNEHYQLAVVGYKMEIEKLKIEAIEHQIALKELELEKLKLQQMLKTKEAQK